MKKIRLGLVNTNYVKICPYTKKGTEIFDYLFIQNLAKRYSKEINATAFCTGDSIVPIKKESISYHSSVEDKNIGEQKQVLYEMSLISKAFGMSNAFDIYHVNLGNGEYVLPFTRFIKKPVVITMHGSTDEKFTNKYYSLYKDQKNIHFVSISEMQKKNSCFGKSRTIYHGIDVTNKFLFNEKGGNNIIWTGRAIPEKGLDEVMMVSKRLKVPTKAFPIIKNEYFNWLYTEVLEKRDIINQINRVRIDFNVIRSKLVIEYQNSKVFLFPVKWEEPFGFTVIESMACGTPVIAYSRGSLPELIKDGVTGFLVNPSEDDIRGDWIIKKTGVEGLCEAVARIYAMKTTEYGVMRKACRMHAEQKFNVNRMVDEYVSLYREILSRK